MRILISGASGLIGKALSEYFQNKGYDILLLQRKDPAIKPYWNIEKQIITFNQDDQIDVVIHLAGESIFEGRWNQNKKERILKSRIEGTKLLSEYFSRIENKPKVFISCSAIGFYGHRENKILSESSKKGLGFLSDVCQEWENATSIAVQSKIRVVNIRLGMVLSEKGGALQKMILPFKMGLGGIIGNGKQYISWISIFDLLNAINHILENNTIEGPINIVTPNPVTNYEFTKTLGKVLHRPTILPLPALLAKIIFGEMAKELLLSSTRVMPEKLKSSGFQFQYPKLEKALIKCLTS